MYSHDVRVDTKCVHIEFGPRHTVAILNIVLRGVNLAINCVRSRDPVPDRSLKRLG